MITRYALRSTLVLYVFCLGCAKVGPDQDNPQVQPIHVVGDNNIIIVMPSQNNSGQTNSNGNASSETDIETEVPVGGVKVGGGSSRRR